MNENRKDELDWTKLGKKHAWSTFCVIIITVGGMALGQVHNAATITIRTTQASFTITLSIN